MLDVVKANEIVMYRNKYNYEQFDVFAQKEYCESLGVKPKDCIYIFSEQFIILVAIIKKYIFRYAVLVSEVQCYSKNGNSSETDFLNDVIEYIHKYYHVHWINQTGTYALYNSIPNNSVAIPFASYILDMDSSEEVLFSKMHSKHRNVVRRALKVGVCVKFGDIELLDDYNEIDRETWARSGKSARGISYYRKLVENLSSVLVAIAYDSHNNPQAGAIIPYCAERGYYLHGCSSNDCVLGASNLLQWEIIRELKKRGVKSYDFVGCRIDADKDSKYHNIQRFKERFGGSLRVGIMFKMIFVKHMYNLYRKIIGLRDGVPYYDIIDQEINKWKDKNLEIVLEELRS